MGGPSGWESQRIVRLNFSSSKGELPLVRACDDLLGACGPFHPASDASDKLDEVRSRLPSIFPPLANRWERLVTEEGKTYYANHATKTTSWNLPDSAKPTLGRALNILPPSWTIEEDEMSRKVYLHSKTQDRTIDRPKLE